MSINIEEDRVAFLIHNPPAICLRLVGEKFEPSCETIYQQEVCKIANIRWESWLAAKEHVAEMLKPVIEPVSIKVMQDKVSGGWHVCELTERIWRGVDDKWFKSKYHAIQWAKERGYRVIEE